MFCFRNGKKHHTGSIKGYKSNGPVERLIRTIEKDMLKEDSKYLIHLLENVFKAYDKSFNKGLVIPPFEAMKTKRKYW